MLGNFRRLARMTKNEMQVEDLQSESWILAHQISQKRGFKIDFSDEQDADLLIRALYVNHVRRGDWKLRKSIRIDNSPSDDDSSINWENLIPARETSDPLYTLLERETGFELEKMLRSSYSQATAYVKMFEHFNFDRETICTYLVIKNDTLLVRFRCAANVVRRQPSLFDRNELIPEDFTGIPGKFYMLPEARSTAGVQMAWKF